MNILGFAIAGIVGLVIVAAIFAGVFNAVTAIKKTHALGLLSLAFTIGTLVELGEMERTRNLIAMREGTGDEFQDDQWGFGQIVALFLWTPLIAMMAFCEFMTCPCTIVDMLKNVKAFLGRYFVLWWLTFRGTLV